MRSLMPARSSTRDSTPCVEVIGPESLETLRQHILLGECCAHQRPGSELNGFPAIST